MHPKVLIAASSRTRGKTLAQALSFLQRGGDVVVGDEQPETWEHYRLLVCELGVRLPSVDPLLENLPEQAHVVVLPSRFTVQQLPQLLEDPRVNHIVRKPSDQELLQELQWVVDKLGSGQIFGIERYLQQRTQVVYRRLSTFAERVKAVDEVVAFAAQKRLRGYVRRTCGQVAEELLMNAMYHAPVDEHGECLFSHVSPAARVRRRTPRPVSLRYGTYKKVLYLSVRDRFGSFRRDKLLHYLTRCTTQEVQIERKKLGAGLGLYLVASSVSRLIINVLPGGLTEVICVFEPPNQTPGMKVFSFTTQRALTPAPDVEDESAD